MDKLKQIGIDHRKEKKEAIDACLKEFDGYLKAVRHLISTQLPHKREGLEFIRDRILDYSKLVAEGAIHPDTARNIIIHIMKNA